ncbi:MAG: hypothetical protein ACD_3C00042G0007 [uncultured bacterium (gcode 4)]|uniref:STAS domain-containing protein n=1 Tax=uncultured bacterium (gcode 4) TaxID=1234023 RepID=K2G2U3_9BACT|nr:MAG: hypothetical protein ACD_3C00042G0007 [uncultured bacterium (gcode 4)]
MVQVFDFKIENWYHIFIFTWPLEQQFVERTFRKIEEMAKNRKIILDLSKVNFVNSTFIWYMYHLFETSRDIWWYMCFVNVNPHIQDAFNLTWIFDIIPYHRDVKAAFDKILIENKWLPK